MFKKYYLTLGLITLLIATGGLVVFGQTAPLSGEVHIKKADGTIVPVANAAVDVYRTDIDKGRMPPAKTNKKGQFNFVGLTLGQTYAIAISGEGIQRNYLSGIKAGADNVVIEVQEGDGKSWTEEELRASVKNAGATQPGGQLTADQKKQQADYEKKLADFNAQKKKAEDSNKVVNAAFQEGDKLFKAKDYAGAIAKFDEGINADPEFEGSAPILLNYKALVLKVRGTDTYNQAITGDEATKAAGREKAKADFNDAIASLDKGLLVIKNAPASTDPAAQKGLQTSKYNLLANYIEVWRLMVKTRSDVSKAKDAAPIFAEYFAVEPDAAKKTAAKITLGDIMLEAGESQAAVDAYVSVLQESPDNVDALAGAGFSLVNLGYMTNDKTKFQEGSNYLQKFIAAAPDSHKFKADAVALIDTLKKEQNVTPQKGGATPKKKGQ